MDEPRQILFDHIRCVVPVDERMEALLTEHTTVERFARHTDIYRGGQTVRKMYFLTAGLTKSSCYDDHGREHVLSFAYEDWWEADYLAFLGETRTEVTLRTLEATTAVGFTLSAYWTLCDEIPSLERFFLHKATRGYAASQQRILSLMTEGPAARYYRLLAAQPRLVGRVSKTQLAAYLGVSRETLSRLRRGK